MEDMDKDQDGYITVEEYIGEFNDVQFYQPSNRRVFQWSIL